MYRSTTNPLKIMVFHLSVRSHALIWKLNLAGWRARWPWKFGRHCSSVSESSGFSPGPLDTSVEVSPDSAEKPPHTPVMLREVLHYLNIQPGQVSSLPFRAWDDPLTAFWPPSSLRLLPWRGRAQVVLDMTFGGGGHTKAILNMVPEVKVLAFDRDPTAISLAEQLAKEHSGQVKPLLGRFSELEVLLPHMNVEPGSIDAVLLDAGCSSMQMDQAERGFSLSKDGPLDMRMDGDRYPDMPSAADVVNTLDQQALASILLAYGEERHARRIASAIVEARRVTPIARTQQLASVVAGSFPAAVVHARKDRLHRPAHVATKTFQALRIFVNDELNELHAGLRAAQQAVRPAGRLCVITFHSLEDRLVKRFLRGDDLSNWDHFGPRTQGARKNKGDGGHVHWLPIRRKVVTPEKEDVQENPRGRSAKLRAALRQ